MHRLTARLLLLFALVGNLVPVALALTAAPPPHACCVRKAAQAHPCHGMAMTTAEPGQLAVRGTACCNHDCCRAITVPRSAQAEPVVADALMPDIAATILYLQFDSPDTGLPELQSTRAPPQYSVA